MINLAVREDNIEVTDAENATGKLATTGSGIPARRRNRYSIHVAGANRINLSSP